MHKIYYWIRLGWDSLRGYITGPKIASASTKLLTPSGLADSTARRGSAAQAHYTKGEKNRKVNLVYTYIERRHGQAPDASRGPASTIYSVNRRTEKTKNRAWSGWGNWPSTWWVKRKEGMDIKRNREREGERRKGWRMEKVRDLEVVELEEAGLSQSTDDHHRLDHGRQTRGGAARLGEIVKASFFVLILKTFCHGTIWWPLT